MLGVRKGADLIVHASLRSIGKVEGGYRSFLEALLLAVGPEGTIIAPAFNYGPIDPAQHSKPLTSDEIEDLREKVKPFDIHLTPSMEGSFADIVRLDTRGTRSNHPVISWAAIGARAYEYTENVSIDDADGLESPIGRIYKAGNGQILLVGVDHVKNTSIHLAEALAGCPHYWNVKIRYKSGKDEWDTFTGCGGCSAGFYKIRGLIDFPRFEIKGKVGKALCYLVEQKPFIDAARIAIAEKPWGLLCERPHCSECQNARQLYGLPPLEEKEYHLRHPWAEKD